MDYWYLNASMLLPFEKLKSLYLSENAIGGNLENEGFQWLSRLTKLETLNLTGNSLKNSILFDMRNLSSLKTLRLSSNQLEGRLLHIQGLSNLINLKKLDLSENQIESLQSSKDGGRKLELTHLKELNLNSNLFNNSVFASLNKLLNLKTLSISNQLKGPIDTKGWCDLRNLEVLDVSGNALEGMLPHCFSNLTALRVLDISRNHFQIPLSFAPFANLSNLKALLSNENKMVTEPSFYTSIPKFQFEVISLSKCITSQQLSRKLPTFLYYQYDLRYVDLSHNNFSGTVPSWLLENNAKLEDLILKGNSFTGPLSFSSALISNVSSIDISENKIQGQIPTSTCSTFPHLSRLFLSKNAFEGNIPLCLSGMKDLSILDLSNNQLYGKVPEELITKGSLTILRLSNNNFSGNHVHLHGNRLRGPLSLAFYNSSSLVTVDLRGNNLTGSIPKWIDTLSSLSVLLLKDNHFHDSYLEEVIEFTTKSGFYSYEGNILAYMTGIDLSCNNLTGHIPPELVNLSEIYSLNLSHNKLMGVIPSSFSKLHQIESLDLSYNNLSGEIPNQLVELNSLEVFSVAHNNLSGSIPEPKAQYGTFIESSYEGNPFLCGTILHKSCSKPDAPSTRSNSLDDEGEDSLLDTYVFCVSFLVSYIVVVLTIFVVLYINPYWRSVWFSFIGKCITTCRYSTMANFLAYHIFRQCD
ncbi:hypothetical protein ES319_1Z008100v1 [Gossypium barbadense]|uniref:Leucine-rich repeat-containing N-terminal plant-type domain-containing protein n=1 Tax=Gossypium barbadense TaxID=3634 RepID=A0A5J5NBQ1_GOSBA|nr:hypothetical protein ES319_1Z008100v1 [Gossypium barbadense]